VRIVHVDLVLDKILGTHGLPDVVVVRAHASEQGIGVDGFSRCFRQIPIMMLWLYVPGATCSSRFSSG
jgi:hypothetical protein